jgi:hypothetical protein
MDTDLVVISQLVRCRKTSDPVLVASARIFAPRFLQTPPRGDTLLNGFADLNRSNKNESPRLHQTQGRGVMGSVQESAQHFLTQWFRQKARTEHRAVRELRDRLPAIRPS